MGVTASDKHARFQMAVLGQHHMTNTLHIAKIFDIIFFCKIPCGLQYGRTFLIDRRDKVIGDQDNLGWIPRAHTHFLKVRPPPPWPTGIVRHDEINGARHDIAGRNGRLAGGAGNDFLNQGLCHWVPNAIRIPMPYTCLVPQKSR